jgi:hypothetical protein
MKEGGSSAFGRSNSSNMFTQKNINPTQIIKQVTIDAIPEAPVAK